MLEDRAIILLALCLPLLAVFGILLFRHRPNVRESVTLITAGLVLVVVLSAIPKVLGGQYPALNLFEVMPGLDIAFKIDSLGMIFAAVAAVLWPVNSLYSIGYMRGNQEKHQTRFYICFAIAISAVMGIAFSANLFTLFIFYEILTLSTYPLVIHKGNNEARAAGRMYLGILLSTSVGLLLPAILWVYQATGTTDFTAGGILKDQIDSHWMLLLLFLFIFGIGKAAIMPMHRWLPAAMVAPTPVSALLHAVAVVKAGVFSVVKIAMFIFGLDTLQSIPLVEYMMYPISFTVILSSIIAMRRDQLKRRLAYSTIAQLAYVVLATMILAPISVMGAALHIAAHAVGKITLFFAAGAIYTASKKTRISELAGIGLRMPWTMAAFTIGGLSMIGVPPAIGFISKWYILMGAYQSQHLFAVGVVLISTLLNVAYFTPIVYTAFFHDETEEQARENPHGEAPLPIIIALMTTSALTILLFLFPNTLFNLAQGVIQ